jgi:hypothetical protein
MRIIHTIGQYKTINRTMSGNNTLCTKRLDSSFREPTMSSVHVVALVSKLYQRTYSHSRVASVLRSLR